MIVIWVLLAIGVIFVFWVVTLSLNDHSERLYGYAPVNTGAVFFGFLPFIILIAGQAGHHHGDNVARVLSIVVALAIIIYMIWWIAQRTSIEVAIAATFISVTVSLVLLVLILGLADNSRRCNSCGSHNCDCW